jgi:DNA-binding winged helix-turn-helix (wHTH) protein/tetratricopeptide (TPR) repeat protein
MMARDDSQAQPNESGHLGVPIVLAREHPFRIGKAEFRPATREVLIAGQASVIEPRVMQLLIALHRANGAVVDKYHLLQSVWDGRIVGDDAINRVVSRLRAVAEKEAGLQFRIETITKVGYRLVSTGREANEGPSLEQAISGGTLSSRHMTIAAAGLILLIVAAGAWLWFRPAPAAAHSMIVRLSGFRTLSANLPAAMRESMNSEITAAFNGDGVVRVLTGPTPTSGTAPAYSLDGTIFRVGDSIRVVTRLTNERSRVVLWSDSVDYPADQVAKVPHKVAVDAGTVIRCGLSGAATYGKPLPDPALNNYMQYCQQYWAYGGSKTLLFAQRVVAEVPDFSWGWSGVANGYMQASFVEPDQQRAAAIRAAGRAAEDKALGLDRTNSEALAHKARLIDPHDWGGQEALFKTAIAAKPLDCGCEHYNYGLALRNVGRLRAAAEQFRAATDMLALWSNSQIALAQTLSAMDRNDQARPYYEAAIDLSKDVNFDKIVAVEGGTETGAYPAAMAALRSPQFQISVPSRAALLSGYEALTSGAPLAKTKAVRGLLALPKDEQSDTVASLLAALGANREAFQVAAQRPWLFWRRSMRGALNEPAFPEVANQLGLMTYWRTSHTKPDVCETKSAPHFCRLI